MTHIFRPSARIELAGQSLSAAEAGLIDARVTLGLNTHATARLTLWTGSKFRSAAPGDPFAIALGPDGAETDIFAGQVTATGPTTDAWVIEAEDAGGWLSRTRATRSFEDMTHADIAGALCAEARIPIEADSTEALAIYYADPSRTIWDHLRVLARLSGTHLVADDKGGIRMTANGGGTHTLRYGATLLDWSLRQQVEPQPVTAAPHSGSHGTWHWIDADPVGDAQGPARIHGVQTNRGSADTATQANAQRAAAAGTRGWIVVSGSPEIRPGDALSLEGLPDGSPTAATTHSVTHSLGGDTGFISTLTVGAGAGTGTGGLLGLVQGVLA